jgi:adenosylcobinamide kinase/adenosylcobinamide-phosphate guanylyltransferase
MRAMLTLIIGGARSGKSMLAERLAGEGGREVVYVATAEARDSEMAARIARHRAQRPAHWRVVEEPLALAAVLCRQAQTERCVLVDCLTLWLCNLLHAGAARFEAERDALLAALPALAGDVVLVGNETGMGVVPVGELSRRFVDESGRLHQAVAACAQRVLLVVAGLPMTLKGDPA